MRDVILKGSIIATFLLAAGCNQSAEERADRLGNKADQIAESAGARIDEAADVAEARIDNAMDRMGAAITPASTPQEFVDLSAKSDAFEIQAAKIATTNASSPKVKAFAQEMIKAHTDSAAKVKAAAATAKLTPNATLTRDQNEDLTELGKLTGTKFDEEYMDGQVEAHEKALALMQSFAADGKEAGLRATAGEIAPVVDKHLAMARALDKKTDR